MEVLIRKYSDLEDYENFIELIESEDEEWHDYLKPRYRTLLQNSITYVAYAEEQFCGYSRSLSDSGFFIWVIDLLVHSDFRGHAIGRKLMECLNKDFPDQDVYVMSDVDEYYEKLGYEKKGSIYKVGKSTEKSR